MDLCEKYNLKPADLDEEYSSPEFACFLWAIECGNLDAVKNILVDYPDVLHNQDSCGMNGFLYATENHKYDIALYLYEKGPEINCGRQYLSGLTWGNYVSGRGFCYENICQFMCSKGLTKFVQLMLKKRVILPDELFEKNIHGVSPYMLAKSNKHKKLAEFLDGIIQQT